MPFKRAHLLYKKSLIQELQAKSNRGKLYKIFFLLFQKIGQYNKEAGTCILSLNGEI